MRRRLDARRGLLRLILPIAAVLAAAAAWGQGAGEAGVERRLALLAAIEGPIGPATSRHVENAIDAARARKAEILILRLNTPGGLATSMRDIIAEVLGAPVPVVGFVAPPGAHAASAGTYILYATHIAAMAPGTNLGAATPVRIGGGGGLPGAPPSDKKGEADKGNGDKAGDKGEAPGGAMEAKAINDAVAFIRSLAELHGRNADWAEMAVREAASLSAEQARARNVIDLIAGDVPALLAAIDGRTVTAGSTQHTLATEGMTVEELEPTFVTRALAVLANPNVAFILLMVGVYGLIFELASPGGIGPGVLGVICLVLGLYALNQLPLNYAGLALIALGIAFMVAEALTPAFGALGLGGLVAFVIGAAMLVDSDSPAIRLSWWAIAAMAALSGGLLILVLGYAWRSHRREPMTGAKGLIGSEGRVIDWSGREGHVWATGERWQARGEASFAADEAVRIRGIDGLTLVVEPVSAGATGIVSERTEHGAKP